MFGGEGGFVKLRRVGLDLVVCDGWSGVGVGV